MSFLSRATIWNLGPIAVLAAICFYVTFALANRAAPVAYVEGRIEPDPVYQGQTITVRWKAEWNRAGCQGYSRRIVVDAKKFQHPKVAELLSSPSVVGTYEYGVEVETGDAWPDGESSYSSTLYLSCNWLQRLFWPIEVKTPTLTFMVVKR